MKNITLHSLLKGIVFASFAGTLLVFLVGFIYTSHIEKLRIEKQRDEVESKLVNFSEKWIADILLNQKNVVLNEIQTKIPNYDLVSVQLIETGPSQIQDSHDAEIVIFIPNENTGRTQERLKVQLKERSEKASNNLMFYLILSLGISFLSLSILSSLVFFYRFKSVMKAIDSSMISDVEEVNANQYSNLGEFSVLLAKVQELKENIRAKEKSQAMTELATQLAHDVRSPLEVLKGIKEDLSELPEGSRRRIQMAINRIEEITFNLLKTHKQVNISTYKEQSEELLGIVSSVVTEKNVEYRNHQNIEILEKFDSSAYGLFSKIERSALKSILSNLINNGIESFYGMSGIIRIDLVATKDKNMIIIRDNGAGVTPGMYTKIFSKGFTTKRTGNGLGLYNAKQDIEAVGGNIGFESIIGKGTTFTITLPKSETPPTFIGSIDAYKYERIIVLDDDPAFHEVWSKRLEGLKSMIEHIHSLDEMLSKYQVLHPKILLLSDFELMDKNLDGIDTILKLKHTEHSVLVTARNEEQAIQDRCLKNGIKLLPKSLVNYVKIVSHVSDASQTSINNLAEVSNLESASIEEDSIVPGFAPQHESGSPNTKASKFGHIVGIQGEDESYNINAAGVIVCSSDIQNGQNLRSTIVLIDDDRFMLLNWSSHCRKNGFPFCGFKSVEEFLAQSSSFDPDCRIYIDSNLGKGIKGEIESEKIFKLGFLNLYLATGYEKNSIQKPKWIKEVFSKNPENIS